MLLSYSPIAYWSEPAPPAVAKGVELVEAKVLISCPVTGEPIKSHSSVPTALTYLL